MEYIDINGCRYARYDTSKDYEKVAKVFGTRSDLVFLHVSVAAGIAGDRWILAFDRFDAPASGAAPLLSKKLTTGESHTFELPQDGLPLYAGIVVAISTTPLYAATSADEMRVTALLRLPNGVKS